MPKLKKFVSMALAVAMVFSIGFSTIAATDLTTFADYDAEKAYIESNSEFASALQLMVDLGVIVGAKNGDELSLNASKSVRRDEFVTMLYKLMNGGKALVSTLYDNQHPFTDVDDWAKTYIGWAYVEEVTAGVGNNQFGSTRSISHASALRMLLTALHVNATLENFNSDNWVSKTAEIARRQEINLIRDLVPNDTNALTRAECAVLFSYALEARTIDYSAVTGIRIYNSTTLGQENFQLLQGTGIVVANQYMTVDSTVGVAGSNKYTIRTTATIDGVDTTSYITVSGSDPLPNDFIGRQVKFALKNGKYGNRVEGVSYRIGSADSAYSLLKTANNKETTVILSGEKMPENWIPQDSTVYVFNGDNATANSSMPVSTLTKNSNTQYSFNTDNVYKSVADMENGILGSGIQVTFVSNSGNDNFQYAFATQYEFYKLEVSDSTVKLLDPSNSNSIDEISLDNVIEGKDLFVDGAYIGLYRIGGKYGAVAVTTLAGKATSFSGNNKVTVGGTQYTVASNMINGRDFFSDTNNEKTTFINNEHTYYLIAGYVVQISGSAVASVEYKYGLVVDSYYKAAVTASGINNTTDSPREARVSILTPENTTVVLNVNKVNSDLTTDGDVSLGSTRTAGGNFLRARELKKVGTSVTAGDLKNGVLISYTVNSDNSINIITAGFDPNTGIMINNIPDGVGENGIDGFDPNYSTSRTNIDISVDEYKRYAGNTVTYIYHAKDKKYVAKIGRSIPTEAEAEATLLSAIFRNKVQDNNDTLNAIFINSKTKSVPDTKWSGFVLATENQVIHESETHVKVTVWDNVSSSVQVYYAYLATQSNTTISQLDSKLASKSYISAATLSGIRLQIADTDLNDIIFAPSDLPDDIFSEIGSGALVKANISATLSTGATLRKHSDNSVAKFVEYDMDGTTCNTKFYIVDGITVTSASRSDMDALVGVSVGSGKYRVLALIEPVGDNMCITRVFIYKEDQ